MSNLLTQWRQEVTWQLERELQGGSFTVVAGERDGPSRDRKLACVYAPTIRSDTDVNFARPVLIVRAWIPKPKTPRETDPPDPEPLEQLMLDVQEALQPIQVLPNVGSGGLYFFVTQVRPDYEDWGVEVTLTGWTHNPATIAA